MSEIDKISCPNCGHSFNAEQALASNIEKQLKKEFQEKARLQSEEFQKRQSALEKQREEFEEKKQKENQIFAEKLQNERARIAKDFENEKLKISKQIEEKAQEKISAQLEQLMKDNEEKRKELSEMRKKEVEILQLQMKLKEEKETMELKLQKQLIEKQQEIENQAKKKFEEQNELRVKEYEKKLEDQKKLIEEMKRKSEQGSMQLQGEIQELAIEEFLKTNYPFDIIDEVKKGVNGADCIQTVRNQMGVECGKILYESKRTKHFGGDWIEKVKQDQRNAKADLCVIVTEAMPIDVDQFTLKDGVWICTFQEFKSLSLALRENIIKVNAAFASQENKGDKMHMLYDYLTGNEFRQQITAIVEAFEMMKSDLDKEKRAMQSIWKRREKQIEKVIENTIAMHGSVRGIAGSSIQSIPSLELGFDGEIDFDEE